MQEGNAILIRTLVQNGSCEIVPCLWYGKLLKIDLSFPRIVGKIIGSWAFFVYMLFLECGFSF